jgi:hypothetical protein
MNLRHHRFKKAANPMGLQYKIEPQKDYLLMTCEGTYLPSLANEFTNEILQACLKHRPTKFLIDFRKVKGEMTTMDRFSLAVIAAKKYIVELLTGKIPGCRFAIVGNHPLVDQGKFEETVAVNRGLNTKTFTDIQEAYAWLEINPEGLKGR